MSYRVKEFLPGCYEVVDKSGHPVYDKALFGGDKPLVFHDSDIALECANELNNKPEDQ